MQHFGVYHVLFYSSLYKTSSGVAERKAKLGELCLRIPAELSPHLQCTCASQQDSHMGTKMHLGAFCGRCVSSFPGGRLRPLREFYD